MKPKLGLIAGAFLLSAFCFPLSGIALFGADCVSPPPGLISWWRAEGNALDAVGTNHGTLTNGATFAPGQVGQAVSFDGTNASLMVPASAAWQFGTGDFTIELWAQFNVIKKSMLIHQLNGDTRGGFEFDLQPQGSGLPPILGLAIDPDHFGIVREWSPAANTWYHLAVTRTAGVFRLFVNGQQLGAEQPDARPLAQVSGPLRIGNYDANDYALNGLIDELAIYQQGLSPAQIAALYAAGSAGKCPPVWLTIQRSSPNTAVVAWASPSTGFQLQQNTNGISSLNWSNVTSGILDDGTNKFIIVDPSSSSRFYRLAKP